MSEAEDSSRFQRFAQAWRESLAASTQLTAAECVRRAVEITRRRRRRRAAGWTLAAAASLAALALTLGRAPGLRPPAPAASASPAGGVVATSPEVVVMWLDAETPLYMTLAPDTGETGGRR